MKFMNLTKWLGTGYQAEEGGESLLGGAGGDTPPEDAPPAEEPPADAPAEEQAKDEPPAEEEKPGAPEAYEFKLPDDMEVDTALLEAAAPLFKELNLSNEDANKLAGVYAAHVAKQEQAKVEQSNAWAKSVVDDPKLGGANLAKNTETAHKAIKQFGGPEISKVLEETGLGNHPALFNMFVNIGAQMTEDSFNGESAAVEKPTLQKLYANSNMNP